MARMNTEEEYLTSVFVRRVGRGFYFSDNNFPFYNFYAKPAVNDKDLISSILKESKVAYGYIHANMEEYNSVAPHYFTFQLNENIMGCDFEFLFYFKGEN